MFRVTFFDVTKARCEHLISVVSMPLAIPKQGQVAAAGDGVADPRSPGDRPSVPRAVGMGQVRVRLLGLVRRYSFPRQIHWDQWSSGSGSGGAGNTIVDSSSGGTGRSCDAQQ